MKTLGFNQLKGTSLSKLWFQNVNLHPYTKEYSLNHTGSEEMEKIAVTYRMLTNGNGREVRVSAQAAL